MDGVPRQRTLTRDALLPDRDALLHLYSRVPFLVHRLEQLATAIHASLSGSGITPGQCQFLAILDALGKMPQADLARLSGCDASTTSLVVENLAERGDVRRRTDPSDLRRKLVEISPGGRRALATALPVLAQVTRLLLEPISGGAREFVSLLQCIAQAPRDAQPRTRATPAATAAGTAALQAVLASPVFLIRRTLQMVDAISSEELSGVDATIRQFAALQLILAHPGICAADLARLGGFEASNVSFMLRLLCGKGFIERDAPASAGRTGYRITATGTAIVRRAEPAMVRTERRLLEPLTAREATQLRRFLARIVAGAAGGRFSMMPHFASVVSESRWSLAATQLPVAAVAGVGAGRARKAIHRSSAASHAGGSAYARTAIAHLIVCSGKRIRTGIDRLLADHDLRRDEFLLIDLIAGGSRADPDGMAGMLDVSARRLSQLARRLESKGFLAPGRGAAADRGRALAITAAGRRAHDAASRRLARHERELLAGLSARVRASLRSGLAALLSRLDAR